MTDKFDYGDWNPKNGKILPASTKLPFSYHFLFHFSLRASKILIIGLSGFGAEIAKNIILSGVKSVTFLDDKKLTVVDGCAQFLAPTTEVGQNRAEVSLPRARALNPMVDITADTESIDKKDAEYFKQFDVVVATGLTKTQLEVVNEHCRAGNSKFFAGDVWGMTGYSFADLQEHEFIQ